MSAGSETSAQTGRIFGVEGFFSERAIFIPGKNKFTSSTRQWRLQASKLPRE
jgi:hypothetical protein